MPSSNPDSPSTPITLSTLDRRNGIYICGLGGRECRVGWAVWEVDPVMKSATEVVAENGQFLSNATTGLEIDGIVYVGSMADTRIGVYRRR